MGVKKILYSLVLSSTISIMSLTPAFASVKAVNADSYNWTKTTSNVWHCVNEKGENVSGWVIHNDSTYYLDKDGLMKTGWIKYKNSWYYLDEEGKLKMEQWIDNCYVNDEGKMTKIR